MPDAADTFVVDVGANQGYLVHANGDALTFPVATGRKSYVHYIGRSYKADTPLRTWVAGQEQIKGDRHTFGVSGRFLRLFRDGEESHYGIHSYYKVDEWMLDDDRYKSMGCIVMTENMMDIMVKTFDLSGKALPVITTNDVPTVLEELTKQESIMKS